MATKKKAAAKKAAPVKKAVKKSAPVEKAGKGAPAVKTKPSMAAAQAWERGEGVACEPDTSNQ